MKKSLHKISPGFYPQKLISALFVLFAVNCSLLTVNCFSQWSQLPNLPVSGTVYDMYFINSNTGWLTFNTTGIILKTTDGGQNWVQQTTPASEVYDIQFFNDTIGVALSYLSTNRLILKTTNGGINWNTIYTTSIGFSNFSFVNKDTGWVCGFDGTFGGVWRTIDGGNNWVRQYTSNSNGLDKIFFLKNKVNGEYWGWTFKSTILFKTTNSGVNWTLITNDLGNSCGDGSDIYFIDTAKGIMTRSGGCLSRTTNGGYNWNNIVEPNITSGCRIAMGDQNKGWVSVAEDSIIKTVNFFQTYGKQITPVIATKIFAIDTSFAWGGLNQSNIMKTTNGGGPIVSVEQISSQTPNRFDLYQNFPNPFNPSTKINFDLPKDGKVTLIIYDLLGRVVKRLLNGEFKQAGRYSIDFNASNYASGVYFYRIEAGDYVQSKKMVLVK